MMLAVGGMLNRRRDWFGMFGEVVYPSFGAANCANQKMNIERGLRPWV